jgi:hypothetical protein
MPAIILKNGKRISGRTWEEVVKNLKNTANFLAEQSVEEYMKGTAERVWIFRQGRINYTDAESFLKGLYQLGILQRVEEGMKRAPRQVFRRGLF